jgi:2-C-methyl-D-erythritol 2,4-cyclodiphosphate synthase
MSAIRVGWGFDAHRFDAHPPLILGGVVVSSDRGIAATSDGDLVVHAVIDGLLGAAALGDIGTFFPSSDQRWHGVDSFEMLAHVMTGVASVGWHATFVDVTIIAETVRMSGFRQAIQSNLATAMGIDPTAVSVKATTTDGLGFIGRDEGIAVTAAVTVMAAEA